MQVWAKEGWTMLAEKQDDAADEKPGEQEVSAKILGTIHVGGGIVPRFEESAKGAPKMFAPTKCSDSESKGRRPLSGEKGTARKAPLHGEESADILPRIESRELRNV
jgi:hypothetical protein